MSDHRRNRLRTIMNVAWGLFRAEPSRGFASCLHGAWAWVRRMAEEAPKLRKRLRSGRGGLGATVRSAAWDRSSSHPYRGVALGRSSAGDSWAGR